MLVVVVHFMFAAMGNDSLQFPQFGFSCGLTVNIKSHPSLRRSFCFFAHGLTYNKTNVGYQRNSFDRSMSSAFVPE